MRTSVVGRFLIIAGAVIMSIYTVDLYAGLFKRWSSNSVSTVEVESIDSNVKKSESDLQMDKKAESVIKMEKKEIPPPALPNVEMAVFPCEMKSSCESTEIPFRIVSGAANIIGPSICVNGKWLMSNGLNNVKRGLNVAAVNGKTGEMTKAEVFDLYGEPSDKFLAFLGERTDDEIIFFATYDDATQKMDDRARKAIAELGSEKVQKLAFRDNWIFAGGKRMKNPTGLEGYVMNEKDKNKFGKWPATVAIEGCIPRLK